jgi:hypothetical protein
MDFGKEDKARLKELFSLLKAERAEGEDCLDAGDIDSMIAASWKIAATSAELTKMIPPATSRPRSTRTDQT